MKKFISTFFAVLFLAVLSFTQNNNNWEDRADRVADWAERLAERVERNAVRTAENLEDRAEIAAINWENWAEDFAEEVEYTFDRGARITVNGENIFYGDICHAFLGIHSDGISKEKARKLGFENTYGSYVTNVVKDSEADKAGLQVFDYIYGIDDQRTSDNQELSDIISDYRPGDVVTVHLIRNGNTKSIQATFGEYESFNWSDDDQAFLGVRPHDREKGSDLDGVKVEIVSNSTAEEMGLEDGDVVVGINSHQILDWSDVSAAINTLKAGDKVEVAYKRDGKELNSSSTIKGRERGGDYSYSYNYEYESNDDNDWNWEWDWNGDDNDDWDGDGAFLGIYTDRISVKKANKLGYDNPHGTVVTGIIKGTAADKAGLQPFDYIFGLDEYRVGDNQSLGGILRKFEPGDDAVVHFYRKGNKEKVNISFGNYADVEKEETDKCQDPFFGIVQIHNGSSADGVSIRPVRNSTASQIGLKENDIITEINGFPMLDWTDISTAIDMLSPGETIEVKYLRDGAEKKASEKIMSYAEAKKCENCDCDNHSISIDIDPEIKAIFKGNKGQERSDWKRNTEPRMNIDEVDVKMEGISSRDADEMKGKGVDMPIESSLEVNHLSLSPNPNMGMFELEFDLPSEGQTLVRVFNPVGRVIYEYDLGRFSGDFADYVDISQNGEGFYFLQISQDSKAFTRKIVLAKN